MRSFERAIVPLLPAIRLSALRLARNQADADDLVQEALVRALRFWPRYQEREHCRAWLQRIVLNTFRSDYRRQLRRRAQLSELESALREEVCEPAPLPPPPSTDAKPLPEEAHLEPQLQHALGRLSDEQRSVIWLVDVKERSYREAAQELACPIGTVMSRLHRARAALRGAVLTAGAHA
jgi:RNA polymerase sigma-70 factor (ECF subfamily)